MAVTLSFYPYNPAQAAAAVVCGLFGISLLISIYQLIRYKTWVWSVMVLVVAMEVVGYGARIISAGDVTARTIFILQFCLIILAPVLMAGIIYVLFARIVFHVVPAQHRKFSLLWVPPRFITPIFVGLDILALFLQLIGAVLISGTQVTDQDAKKRIDLGKALALTGVSTQIGAFGLFTIAAIRFHFTSRRFRDNSDRGAGGPDRAKYITLEGSARSINRHWQTILWVVNLSCILILIRSVYREIEFASGKEGYVHFHEWFIYVFDALPMFIVVASYNLVHPGQYLPHMGFRLPKSERGVYRADASTSAPVELRTR